MCLKEGKSVAQYHVCLRPQLAPCEYTDPDDVIRSKILQTMHAKKLHREAMVKRYTLQQLLEHTANKKRNRSPSSGYGSKVCTGSRPSLKNSPKKPLKPKDKRKPKQPHDDKNESECQFCYKDHKGPRSNRPASGKKYGVCSNKGHFARMFKR